MKSEMLLAIENYPVIKQYLANIPENAWDILLPESVDDLTQFSSDIRSCLAQGEERDFIMKVQSDHELPLRPNASVRATVIAVRIEHLRKKHRRLESGPANDENPLSDSDGGGELA